jgi:hypothetical protein
MSQLRGWLFLATETPSTNFNTISLMEDWEWVLSSSEILSNIHAEKETKKLKEELEKVREFGSWMKMKSKFSLTAKLLLENLEHEPKSEISSPLTGPMMSKIVSDTVEFFQRDWLELIKEQISLNGMSCVEEYEKSWPEIKPYQKNVIGAVKEMVFYSFQQ